jgi:hypothetical protein
MLSKIRNYWNSLPHQVQAIILLFATAAGTTLGKELQELFLGNEAFTWLSLKHDICVAAIAGFAAVRMFYMFPNGITKQLPAPPQQASSNPQGAAQV